MALKFVSIAGNTIATLNVSPTDRLRDVAFCLVNECPDYFGADELELVDEQATLLKLGLTVKDNNLSAGDSITAVRRVDGWKAELPSPQVVLVTQPCACLGHDCWWCDTVGHNLKINENALRTIFRVGKTTKLSSMLQTFGNCNVDWILDHSGESYFWHCSNCAQTAWTVHYNCQPHAGNSIPWQVDSITGIVVCGTCFAKATGMMTCSDGDS